ncbi:DUF3717 domain-containing protein [Undibacterium terreum]|uniref:DUF3717 domain-containing protein n=1 Tax=Undibacterium terreum TaxID=1224302 RepID=A0A916UZE6_9BURK|nr:DUF3717 domain-containing protein [Undibacterium terreum]GGC95427.1 hypothetical protein GCM10011396_48490 [Undibacterium terreum]
MNITLPELEAAINYWRQQRPATGDECALSPEVNILASEYALMIFHRKKEIAAQELKPNAQSLLRIWQASKS